LGSVDNTADAAKPVSTSQAAADAAVQAFSIQRTNHTGTQAASTISDFVTEAAKYGPVTSVSGRTGAVTLAQLGTSGTASSTTFLRGDGAWTAAGSTDASLLTSGTVAATRLPLATTTLAGAVIVGSGLTITSGVLSRSSTYDPAAAPGAPSGISFTGYLVSWNPSPGGVATYYEVQWVISSGSYTTLATNVAGTTLGYSYNGSTIYFRVRGYNADSLPGEWGYQEGAPGGGSGGGSYTLPTATSSVLGGIKVGSGLSITDGVLAATGGGGGSVASAASTAAFPATGDSATLYIATDVGRLFRWTGSVYAEIGPISGGGSDARWDYLKPAAPTSVTAFPGNAQALITWTAPSGVIAQAPIQDYVVQFSSNSGSSWATFSDAISTATSATVTGLANSVAVIFRVAATNGIGTGVFSAASAAVTPGVFDPSTISGLTAWYDASDAATLYSASSGGSLVTADAASVLRWQDKSGNSHHLINSTSGEAPVLKTSLINSRNAIRFDGTDDRLIASALNLTSASASTLVAVMKFRSSSGFAIAVAFGTQSSFGAHTIEKNRSSSRFSFSAGSYTLGSEYSIGAAAPNTNTNSLASVFSSGTLTSYVNNTQDATGSVVASLSSGSGLSVGGYFANGYNADIDACEILYYNRAITSTERGDLHGYLASKWGL